MKRHYTFQAMPTNSRRMHRPAVGRTAVFDGRTAKLNGANVLAVACATMLAFAALVAAASAETILFRDTFDRANSTNLNASTAGKTGTWGPLTWGSILVGTAPVLDIDTNALRTDNGTNDAGANGVIAYLSNHNFTDSAIAAAGQFTVSVDLTASASGGDGRYPGFGIGQSLADITSMTGTQPTNGVADVYVGYDTFGGTTGIAIFHNGVLQGHTAFAASLPDALTATFTFSDMNAGTALNYEVFVDGVSTVSGSTTWSGTNENYIGLQSNTTGNTRFDTFEVSTVPHPSTVIYSEVFTTDSDTSVGAFGWTAYKNNGTDLSNTSSGEMLVFSADFIFIGSGASFTGGAYVTLSDAPTIDPTAYEDDLTISFRQSATDDGTSSVGQMGWRALVQVGSTWYASDFLPFTTSQEIYSIGLANSDWFAWETDLTDGFSIAGISGTAMSLPLGDIIGTGVLAIDGNHNNDRMRIHNFEITGTAIAVAIPESSSFALAGFGILSLGLAGWRQRRRLW